MWFICLTVFAVHKNCFHVLNNVNQTFIDVFCKFFWSVQKCSSCLISFLSFSELFSAFNWASKIGNLLSIWFDVSIFNPRPGWFFLCAADSSLSKSGILSCHLTLSKISSIAFTKFSNFVRESSNSINLIFQNS